MDSVGLVAELIVVEQRVNTSSNDLFGSLKHEDQFASLMPSVSNEAAVKTTFLSGNDKASRREFDTAIFQLSCTPLFGMKQTTLEIIRPSKPCINSPEANRSHLLYCSQPNKFVGARDLNVVGKDFFTLTDSNRLDA